MFRKKMFLALIITAVLLTALAGCSTTGYVTISFDSTGGSAVRSMRVYPSDTSLDLPTPTREGYNFDCWCTDSALSQRVDTTSLPTEDIVLYARWNLARISITFKTDNDNEEQTMQVYYGSDLSVQNMPVVPARPGMTGSWDTEDLKNITSSKTIYAIYSAKIFSVNYYIGNENKDNPYYFTQSGEIGTVIDVPDEPKIESKVFFGWYYDKNFTEKCTDLPTAIEANDVFLYARFESASSVPFLTEDNEDGITITGLKPSAKPGSTLVFPSKIGEKSVTEIGTKNISPSNIKSVIDGFDIIKSVYIPSSVKRINLCAFFNCSSINELMLNEGLTEIGEFAFNACSSLKAVHIPSTVIAVKDYAFARSSIITASSEPMSLTQVVFANNSQLQNIAATAFNETDIEKFVLPDSDDYVFSPDCFSCCSVKEFSIVSEKYVIENGAVYSADFSELIYFNGESLVINPKTLSIGASAFAFNKSIMAVSVPASVKTIGNRAFYNCENLTSVTFESDEKRGSALESIGNSAFEGSGLNEISLPIKLNAIGSSAFYGCKQLTSVVILGNELSAIPDYAFCNCSEFKSFGIPSNISSIGKGAFMHCKNLSTLTFANGSCLERIDDYAFYGCSSLKAISLHNTIKYIGSYAFADREKKLSIQPAIPNSLEEIGEYAFMNSGVTSFAPSASLRVLGEGAFYNCSNLSKLSLSRIKFDALPDYLFYGCTGIVSVTVSSTVEAFGNFVFFNCTRLSSVQFDRVDSGSDGLKTIGRSCFEGCTSLESGSGGNNVIPSSLTYMGERAFYGCTALNTISIPGGLIRIPKEAFSHCSNLRYVTFYGGETDTLEEESFAYCTSLSQITLPSNLKARDADNSCGAVKNPFIGCSALTSLNITGNPNNLVAENGIIYRTDGDKKYIHLYPNGCITDTNSTVTVGADINGIDDYAFYGSLISELNFDSPTAGNYYNLVKIGAYAFAESSLTTAALSRNVNVISDYAFYNSALETLTVESEILTGANIGLTDIGSATTTVNFLTFGAYSFARTAIDNLNVPKRATSIGTGTFSDCYSLELLTFDEDGAELTIEASAFRYDISLTKIVFPSSVTSIGDYAFDSCYNIADVIFEHSDSCLIDIGDYAFASNHYLQEIILPPIGSLGEGVFSNCTRLTDVVFPSENSSPYDIPAYAFYGCKSLLEFYIPEYITGIGESAFQGSKLHSLVFSDSPSEHELIIGDYAFENTADLLSVFFPPRLSAIGNSAFAFSGITTFEYGIGRSVTVDDNAFRGSALKSVTITERLNLSGTGIFAETRFLQSARFVAAENIDTGDRTFSDSAISEVDFAGSVCRIGAVAFEKTPNLKSVELTLDDSDGEPAVIAESAFAQSGITSFVINGSAKLTVNQYAFESTQELAEITIVSDSLRLKDGVFSDSGISVLRLNGQIDYVGNGVAKGAKKLREIIASDVVGNYIAHNGILYMRTGNSLTLCQYPAGKPGAVYDFVRDVTFVPNAYLSYIMPDAFSGNLNLTTIVADGEKPVKCSSSAFYNTNSALTLYTGEQNKEAYSSLNIAVETIKKEYNELVLSLIGSDRYSVTGYTGRGDDNGNLTIAGTIGDCKIENIGKDAFRNNAALRSVTIGDGIKEICDYAFANCLNLQSLSLSNNVTAIHPHAFDGCSSLQSISFKEGLTSIKEYAFASCKSLTNISFPDSLRTIGAFAFSDNTALSNITFGSGLTELGDDAFYGDTGLISVHLPPSLKKLNEYVFRRCSNLIFIYLHSADVVSLSSARSLGQTASDLKILVADDLIKSYRSHTDWREFSDRILSFDDISKEPGFESYVLKPLSGNEYKLVCYLGTEKDVTVNPKIGDGLITEIGSYAFNHFNVNIVIDDFKEVISDGENIKTEFFGITKIDDYAFANATNLESISLPNALKSIGTGAFRDLKKLTNVYLEASYYENPRARLQSIGDYAFYGCSSIRDFHLPYFLTDIGKYAFSGDDMSLETLSVARSLLALNIKEYAFANNRDLETVIFPRAIQYLGNGAFMNCDNLEYIYFENDTVPIIENDAHDVFTGCDRLVLLVPNAESYRESWDGHQFDTAKLFSQSYMTSDDGFVINPINNSTSSASIISYLGSDSTVVFPSEIKVENTTYTITRLGRPNNNSDSVANGLVIGNNVKEIVIPSTVIEITGDAFRGAKGLEKVSFDADMPSSLSLIGSYAFYECDNLTEVNLPKSLSNISPYAFGNCPSLKYVNFEEYRDIDSIPSSVSMIIGDHAFDGCALNEINLPLHTGSIGKYAFNNASELKEINISSEARLSKINDYAFAGTAIYGLTIPENVSSVGDGIFSLCENLQYVRLTRVPGIKYNGITSATQKVFDGVDGKFVKVYVPANAFTAYRYSRGWDAKTIIQDLTSGDFKYRIIGYSAILTDYIGDAVDLFIPKSITAEDGQNYDIDSITEYFGNEKIKTVRFADDSNLRTLESYAFAECSSLETIVLPKNLSALGERAFNNCVSLKHVELPVPTDDKQVSIDKLSSYLFSGCSSLSEIYIPSSVKSIEAFAFNNCTSLSRVEMGSQSSVTLGRNAFLNTGKSLLIIVPDSIRCMEDYRAMWTDVADIIYDRSYLFGDFILSENETGFTLLQYSGHVDSLDLNYLVIRGKKITEISENAILYPDTELIF